MRVERKIKVIIPDDRDRDFIHENIYHKITHIYHDNEENTYIFYMEAEQ